MSDYLSANNKAEEVLNTDFPGVADPQGLIRYHHYIVTNTKGTDGSIKNVDEREFWRTNGHKDACIEGPEEDKYANCAEIKLGALPYIADINKNAKFKDGVYKVHVVMKDMIPAHTQKVDTDVVVDNFLPFVEEVEVSTSDGETIYHAGWAFSIGSIILTKDDQLEWVDYVDPKDLTPGESLQIRISTSEAMKTVSLELFGKYFSSESTDDTSKIRNVDDAGMIWETTVQTPLEFPDDDPHFFTLLIEGRDYAENEILNFTDKEPKPVPQRTGQSFPEPEWDPMPLTGTDTVHQLGAILSEPFTWSLTMPTSGICDLDVEHGGIVCTFDGDKGRVTFSPKDRAPTDHTQYVLIDAVDHAQNTWEGTYYAPRHQGITAPMGLTITWEPQEAWFPFREPAPDATQMWCAEVPDDMPGVDTDGSTPTTRDDKGPPDRGTDTATLQGIISAQPNPAAESCQIRVTWKTEDGQVIEEAGTLLLDLQPQSLCQTLQEESELLEATATYPWDVANRLTYFGCHIVDEQTELLENIRVNTTRKYWPISDHEKVLEPGECRSWYKKELMFRFLPERWPSQPPQDIPFPASPEEGDVAIHYECQWYEEVDAPFDLLVYTTHWTWTYRCPMVYVEDEGRQTPYLGGYNCDKTITQITWECGDACIYQEQPGEFVPPVPVLEREWTLHP